MAVFSDLRRPRVKRLLDFFALRMPADSAISRVTYYRGLLSILAVHFTSYSYGAPE
jgi:hypothetical protein